MAIAARNFHTRRESLPPMNNPLTILGIAGSLRAGSYNRAALRAAQELVPENTRLDIFDIDGLPGFNQDQEQQPPRKIVQLKQRLRAADGVLIVTPEYNYSVPGVLKNAIDWASRPYGDSAWNGKPVAIMGATIGSFGTARAQHHLRQMFVFLNMPCVLQPEVMIANAPQHFDAQGRLTNPDTRKLIGALLLALVRLVRTRSESAHPGA
jgi:chromate reductase